MLICIKIAPNQMNSIWNSIKLLIKCMKLFISFWSITLFLCEYAMCIELLCSKFFSKNKKRRIWHLETFFSRKLGYLQIWRNKKKVLISNWFYVSTLSLRKRINCENGFLLCLLHKKNSKTKKLNSNTTLKLQSFFFHLFFSHILPKHWS